MTRTIICANDRCAKEVHASDPRVKYCSLGCSQAVYKRRERQRVRDARQPQKCAETSCENEFIRTCKGRKLYCSKACCWKAKRIKNGQRVTIDQRPCELCKTDYTPHIRKQRWCSELCRNRARTAGNEPVRKVCALHGCMKRFDTLNPGKIYCCKEHMTKAKKLKAKANGYVRPSADARKRETKPSAGVVHGKGLSFSGFSESAPRQAMTAVTGCPTCRASGKDYRGNIIHSSWCKEADCG